MVVQYSNGSNRSGGGVGGGGDAAVVYSIHDLKIPPQICTTHLDFMTQMPSLHTIVALIDELCGM